MTWFKLDDGFHSHPKVLEVGNEATGLYVRCGSYCAQHLTDGLVSPGVLMLYGNAELAATLVRARLWRVVDGGWQMNDYLTYNPSREQVEAEREAAAERQRRAREKRTTDRAATDGHPVTNGSSHGVSHGDVTRNQGDYRNAPVTVPRPDPSRPVVPNGTTSGARKRGTRIPDDFAVTPDMVTWAREKCPDVDGKRETEKFINHFQSASGAKGVKLDWGRTWMNWMMTADERLPRHLHAVPSRPVVLPADPILALADIRARGAAKEAARLIGAPWYEPAQPPSDRTPPGEWMRAQHVAWIDQHAAEIRAALKQKQVG